jgi:hypothetical protein
MYSFINIKLHKSQNGNNFVKQKCVLRCVNIYYKYHYLRYSLSSCILTTDITSSIILCYVANFRAFPDVTAVVFKFTNLLVCY